ncbi:DUF5335 family protein [Geodermatophilus ruber]|uniref:Uncharacterized protein n=1 Tax=Geodermatophilus ruber TaxID=504800 RepID=A0A1I4JXQ4_9ACTN|nr:DUF5335 family protein [Geodermatophilus ruber]SFL71234.1 hypothetical protein SAMN04488085_1166 [Geodermatophilus ruber]
MAVVSPEQRTEWTRLTDRLTAEYRGYDVTVEVLDPEIGDQPLVDRLPFDNVTYDYKDDVAVVAAAEDPEHEDVALRHMVNHPREFVVDLIPEGAALKITDDGGTTTLVSLVRHQDASSQGA